MKREIFPRLTLAFLICHFPIQLHAHDECTDHAECFSGIWVSFTSSAEVPGLGTVTNEDIVAYDEVEGVWRLVMDGSDLGLSALTLDGLARDASGNLLLSFTAPGNVPGLLDGPNGGTAIDDSDVIRFVPTALGPNTAGSLEFYFDGSDVELTTDAEDLDALSVTPDGRLVFSTLGTMQAQAQLGNEKDLWIFNATSLGSNTSGTFEVLVRGLTLGLDGSAAENLYALHLIDMREVLLSTAGNYSAGGISGTNDEILRVVSPSWQIPGTVHSLVMDLAAMGIDPSESIGGLDWVGPRFPDVRFTCDPLDGPSPLTVHCTAVPADGEALPDATYHWTLDGTEISGPLPTHGAVSFEIKESGMHSIALSVLLTGSLAPLACTDVETGHFQSRPRIWPQIEGQVTDDSGAGIAGVSIFTLVESAWTTTDSNGDFALPVPFGWSGFFLAVHDTFEFTPTIRYLDNMQNTALGQNFAAVPLSALRLFGTVSNFQGLPQEGIVVHFSGTGDYSGTTMETITDAAGHYQREPPIGWTGTLSTGPNHRFHLSSEQILEVGSASLQQDLVVYRNYYVAPDGNDHTGVGELAYPYKTIQKATSKARPGDTVILRGGTYDLQADPAYELGVIYFSHSGREGEPITVEAYASEIVELTTAGSKPVFDFADTWGHRTAGFGHYVFRNLRITGGRYGWIFRPPVPTTWQPGHPISALWGNQIHDVLIEDCEVNGNGTVESALYVRYAGIRNLTVRRCDFHHTIGTEGTVDIGEWQDLHPAHLVPRSASHDLLFEDCDFHDTVHQQANGIVTQPCTFNVTLRRCRAWNNGKYGFACKGSGNFRLDRCASWGNDSSQMYCRGFGGDDATARPFYLNDFRLTNCVFVAPADQRGGSAMNWRENCDLRAYHCTIVGLRNEAHRQAGGYAFSLGNAHNIPSKAILQNCLVAGYTHSQAIRFSVSGVGPYLPNTRYEGRTNLFFAEPTTKFKNQSDNWRTLSEWQAYWAAGEPGGDDALLGPSATHADATSLFADPMFAMVNPLQAPLRKHWAPDLLAPSNYMDVRPAAGSPALQLGENLSGLGISELDFDHLGASRPQSSPWTVGAFQVPVHSGN